MLSTQVVGTDQERSWDPAGEWSRAAGRACSTAIGARILEDYSRLTRRQER